MTRAAAIQLNSTDDAERNRATAERLVREAAARGAQLVVLPEKWTGSAARAHGGGRRAARRPVASRGRARSPASSASTSWRARSPSTRRGEASSQHVACTSAPTARSRAVYRKLHLFDVEVAGTVYRESEHESRATSSSSRQPADGAELGMSICYDLRFPELYRILRVRGARVIAVPPPSR